MSTRAKTAKVGSEPQAEESHPLAIVFAGRERTLFLYTQTEAKRFGTHLLRSGKTTKRGVDDFLKHVARSALPLT